MTGDKHPTLHYTPSGDPEDPSYLDSVNIDRERRDKLYYPILALFVGVLALTFRYQTNTPFIISWHLVGWFQILTALGALSTFYAQDFAQNDVSETQQSLHWDRKAGQLIEEGQTDGRGVNTPALVKIYFEHQVHARAAQKFTRWCNFMYLCQNVFLLASVVLGGVLAAFGKITV